MRIVIAPDSFKGSATATEVAAALADGWGQERPSDDIRLIPMADGGEGTLDAFAVAVPEARRMPVTVSGPDDRPVRTSWLLLPGGGSGEYEGSTGVVELAATSGITLLDPLQPRAAHTRGFGEAITAALDAGVTRLILGIGGSASTDGGAGALRALGGHLTDATGAPIADGNPGLATIAHVDLSGLRPLPPGGVEILSDVTNPLLGPLGASAVFGPQKGADPATVDELEANLARFAALVDVDPATPGAGAAGGTGFGLLAWGAVLAPGSAAVGEALGLPQVMHEADAVITGEGRFDAQSAAGKVPGYVSGLAGAAGARALLVAGGIQAPTNQFAAAVSLTELSGGVDAALADPLFWLRVAGERLAASVA